MRNYAKEWEWRKNRYNEIKVSIDKELAEKLRKKLKENNKSIASWITENAVKYVNSEN